MAYTSKLDTSIIVEVQTVNPDNGAVVFSYIGTDATIELADVKAYYTYVRGDGTIIPVYCSLIMDSGKTIVVSETYAAIDAVLNP